MRCVPVAAEVEYRSGVFDEPIFSDSACSTRVTVAVKGAGRSCAEQRDPQFFVEYAHSACEPRRVARHPAQTIRAPARLFRKDGARCVPHQLGAPNDFFDFFAGASEIVDPGEFVALTKRIHRPLGGSP